MDYDVMAAKEQEEHHQFMSDEAQDDRLIRRVLLDEAIERLRKAWYV